ncbi:MAG: hypothetical protein VYC72_01900 [Verrucomicrobiota bacterium]|nr:hypothetical protein [Verrucomicrobiota bacterium]
MKLIRISLIFLSLIELSNADSIYKNNFESYELNKFPDDMMEIDGLFKVNKNDQGKKHLEMASEPLTENAVIFGPSIKNSATLEVKVRGFKKRRSYPRFGIGLHGISGFRLRVVPSKNKIELVKNEEPVKSVPFEWNSEKWSNLRLQIEFSNDKSLIKGWVWDDGSTPTVEPVITFSHDGTPGQGKASIWGTAYSGKVILFDDISLKYKKEK